MKLLNPLPQRLDTGATPTFAGLLAGDGTAAAPSIAFLSQSGLGIYRVATGILGFVSGGGGLTLNLTTGTPKFSAFNYAASIAIQDAVNGNIILTPSGTGVVSVGSIIAGSAFPNSQLDVNSTGVTLQASSIIDFKTGAGAQAARFQSNARFCLGTTTDSANGVLQLATHTAKTGGIGFGTSDSLYRTGPATLNWDADTGDASFNLRMSGAVVGTLTGDTVNFYVSSSVGDGIIFRTNGTTNALTLDASQGATFSAAPAAGFCAKFNQVGGTNPVVILQEGGVNKSQWSSFSGDVYFDSLTAGKSLVLRSGAQVTALTLDGNQNAAFAAAVTHSSVTGLGLTATSSTWAALGVGTTARSSLRMGHGVAPTSPVDGDMWTTTAGAFIRINGVTKTFTLI